MITTINGVAIDAIACAVPSNCFSIFDYCDGLVTEKEANRLSKNTGFEKLRITDNKTTTSDLCFNAAEHIFNSDGAYRKSDIDGLIFVSQTSDYYLPATSHELQSRMGLSNNMLCFDINQGCSGYVNGLYLAALLVSSGQCRKVLLLTGDTASKLTSPTDRATRTIFGDAGTATIISVGEQNIVFNIQTFGDRFKAIIVPNSRHRKENLPDNSGYVSLDGMGIMNFTLDEVPKNIEQLLDYTKTSKSEIKLYACHQANKLILKSLADRLGVEQDKVPFIAGETGNTSSASIPLLLAEIADDKKLLQKVCCAGFGVGLSVASCIVDLSSTKFFETEIL